MVLHCGYFANDEETAAELGVSVESIRKNRERYEATKAREVPVKEPLTHLEYRAVFSYPDSILGKTPDDYSAPVINKKDLPTHAPRSEESHGWVSAIQIREVSSWRNET